MYRLKSELDKISANYTYLNAQKFKFSFNNFIFHLGFIVLTIMEKIKTPAVLTLK